MSTTFLAPDPLQGTFLIPGSNTPGSGVQLFLYAAGSSTKQTAYKDSAGSSAWSNPIVLDSGGNLPSGGVIWLTSGTPYKAVYAPSNDTDPPASPYRTIDNLSGINDVTAAAAGTEWTAGPAVTYIGSTQFSVLGDQTATLTVGRRVRTTNTGGAVYGYITTSSFGATITTVTIATDSGSLDSGLSSMSYGLLSSVNVSYPTPIVSSYKVVGCNCLNNSGTPNTQFDMNADAVVLKDSSNRTVVRTNPGSITNNVSTASSANGRDQAGAFTASTFVYFYWIWNGATLATLSSATAPPTGPTLPSGYTHWAYAGAVYFDASSHLVRTRFKGAWAYLDAPNAVLSAGSASAETALTITGVVPSNALEFRGNLYGTLAGSGSFNSTINLRVITAVNYFIVSCNGTGAVINSFGCEFSAPNISQTLYYLFTPTTNVSAASINLNISGYKNPNGGE